MARILIPLPSTGFDPTESGVPWQILAADGHEVAFATPDGKPGTCDPIMLSGEGIGPLGRWLKAEPAGRNAWEAMAASPVFRAPMAWAAMAAKDFDGILLPGGHAKGMRPYIESPEVRSVIAAFMQADRPVAAICHGVLPVARALLPDSRSVLHGRKTTSLLRNQELAAWRVTRRWAGDYYRTYPETVQDEVTAALASPADFVVGPLPILRDTPARLSRGFVLRDRNYLSARWPGDAHAFARAFSTLLSP